MKFHKDSPTPFCNSCIRKEPPRYNYWNLTFEGKYIDDDEWEKALKIYGEMH